MAEADGADVSGLVRPVRAITAALAAYFALVFTAGFFLGAIRTLLVAPQIGQVAAVALEAIAMLAISWIACGAALRGFAVPPRRADRIVMSVAALAFLMSADAVIGWLLFDLPLGEAFAGWATPAGAIGLASQIAFALWPLVRRGDLVGAG
jgi:hypothetical protein